MHASNRPRRRLATGLVAATLVAGSATWALAANPAPETYAFVARGDNPVDALAAAPLAGRLNAPVVLTESTVLTDAAADALEKADPDNVIIAGGLVAINNDVRDAIRDLLPGATVQRASGETRYDTSEAIADLFGDIDPSFLASDGKANDAYAFGGLEPDEYQFSIVQRLGDEETFTAPTAPAGHDSLVDIMDPMTFEAPVDGVIRTELLAGAEGATSGPLPMYVLLDSDVTTFDNGDPNESTALLNRVSAAYLDNSEISIPLRVDAGTHTLRVVAFADSGEEVTASFRSVVAHFTAGVTGTWEEFVPPPPPAPSATGDASGSNSVWPFPTE